MAADRGKAKGKKASPPATLSELIAAKNYPAAIEVLRTQLAQRPGIQTRLQLADLLLLAGRRDEALPIFMSLADELAKDGFIAKALAILKRVDRLDPGRADVEARLAELARSPSARSALLPAPAPPPPKPPVFGMEEIGHEPAVEAPKPAEAAPGAPATESAPAPPPAPAPEPAPEAPIEAATTPASALSPVAAEAPPAPPATPVERKKDTAGLGGIWKRLMTALAAPAVDAPAAPPATEPAPSTPPEPATPPAAEGATETAPEQKAAAEGDAPAEDTAKPAPEKPAAPPSSEPVVEAIEAKDEAAATEAAPPPPDVAPSEPALEPNAEPIVEPEEESEPHATRMSTAADGGEPVVVIETETETVVEEPAAAAAPVEPAAAEAPAESPAVVAKLGGVFKKFLANLPGGEPAPAPVPADVPEPEPTVETKDQEELDFAAVLSAAGIDPASANEDEEAFFDSFIDEDDSAPIEEPIALPPPSPTAAGADLGPTATLPPMPTGAGPKWTSPMNEAGFRDQVLDLIEDVLKRPAEVTPAAPGETTEPIANAYKDELMAHPLFRDLSENEMLAMLRALRLACFDPGEIIVSEGEPGAGLFLLIAGAVKVFARNPSGHNLPVGLLSEGTFFGEMSLLSGKPRNATVTATCPVELLELPKPLLDAIAISHPRVRDIVDALYLQRANSPEMAAVRNVPIGDLQTRERAMQVLKGYFGGRRWEPRMQLKLAMVLLKAGKEDEAVPVLVDLAETLLREGNAAKAIAILKKVEAIRKRSLQEVNLAPLKADDEGLEEDATGIGPPVPTPAGEKRRWAGRTQAFFSDWLVTARRRSAEAQAAPRKLPGYGPELQASPLFEGFSEEELLAFIQGLRLSVYEPGDIILTEGEPGQSVFILTVGSVRVFVRNPSGHDLQVCQLKEGAFFGEMSALSGRPRTATVTAGTRCEVLEMDRTTLDTIAQTHPRIKQVLEEVYIERASSSTAERIRTTSAPPA